MIMHVIYMTFQILTTDSSLLLVIDLYGTFVTHNFYDKNK